MKHHNASHGGRTRGFAPTHCEIVVSNETSQCVTWWANPRVRPYTMGNLCIHGVAVIFDDPHDVSHGNTMGIVVSDDIQRYPGPARRIYSIPKSFGKWVGFSVGASPTTPFQLRQECYSNPQSFVKGHSRLPRAVLGSRFSVLVGSLYQVYSKNGATRCRNAVA
jgi:hypothetical protein